MRLDARPTGLVNLRQTKIIRQYHILTSDYTMSIQITIPVYSPISPPNPSPKKISKTSAHKEIHKSISTHSAINQNPQQQKDKLPFPWSLRPRSVSTHAPARNSRIYCYHLSDVPVLEASFVNLWIKYLLVQATYSFNGVKSKSSYLYIYKYQE